MNTPQIVEALVGGVVGCDEATAACPELERLRQRAGPDVPLQWLLLTVDLPVARRLLRRSAQALLRLLDVADVAWATDALDDAGKFRAILHAPPWVLRPGTPDDRDEDVALVLERDGDFHGNWYGLLEALHQAGSVEWQWAIHRCRAMMRFESTTGLDVADVLGVRGSTAAPETAAEIEPIRSD